MEPPAPCSATATTTTAASPPRSGVPVYCHPAEVGLVEGDAGYCDYQIDNLRGPARYLLPRLLKRWDGGPVAVSKTLEEGDEIAGFRVIPLPGHTRGSIGLWREYDGVALTSDCYYSINVETGLKSAPSVPHSAFTVDLDMARQSIRKLASLNPSVTLAGHGDPLRGAVTEQLCVLTRTTAEAKPHTAPVPVVLGVSGYAMVSR